MLHRCGTLLQAAYRELYKFDRGDDDELFNEKEKAGRQD